MNFTSKRQVKVLYQTLASNTFITQKKLTAYFPTKNKTNFTISLLYYHLLFLKQLILVKKTISSQLTLLTFFPNKLF